MEKETTGLYLTGHPMDAYRDTVQRIHARDSSSILEDFPKRAGLSASDEQRVTICGVVTASKTKTTKNNSLMAYVTVEDDTASIELLCFSRVLDTCGPISGKNQAVVIKGKLFCPGRESPPAHL